MKKCNPIIRNAIKGPVSSVLGLVIIATTSYNATFGDLEWIWNGLIGCGVGAVLIFTPDSIKTIIESVVKKKTS